MPPAIVGGKIVRRRMIFCSYDFGVSLHGMSPDQVPPPATPPLDDLAWLAMRAADALASSFTTVSREAGLSDLRDWLVLALVSDGRQRTQLEIADELAIDKTTLVAVLDRLEREGLVVRTASDRDRRVRIPVATEKGVAVKEQVKVARDAALNRRLASIAEKDRAHFHATLWAIVQGQDGS